MFNYNVGKNNRLRNQNQSLTIIQFSSLKSLYCFGINVPLPPFYDYSKFPLFPRLRNFIEKILICNDEISPFP